MNVPCACPLAHAFSQSALSQSRGRGAFAHGGALRYAKCLTEDTEAGAMGGGVMMEEDGLPWPGGRSCRAVQNLMVSAAHSGGAAAVR